MAALFLLFVLVITGTGPITAAEPGTTEPTKWIARSWTTEDGLPQNSVNALLQTREGFLWIGTSAGLARFDGKSFRRFGLQDGLRSVYIACLAEDKEGAVWIGTSGGGVSRFQNGRITNLGETEGFPKGADVLDLKAGHDGSIWIGTTKGLLQWRNDALKPLALSDGLPQNQARALATDTQGNVWVSFVPGGIYRGINGRFSRVTGGKEEPRSAYSLLGDRDGSMWAGMGDSELWHWQNDMWQRHTAGDTAPKTNIEGLAQDADGVLWVGGNNNGIHRFHAGKLEDIPDAAGLSNANVRTVIVDRDGAVWLGTTARGLFRLSKRVLEYSGSEEGLPSVSLTSMAEDTSGTWWAGTASKGIYRAVPGGAFNKVADSAVSGNYPFIYCVAATSDGAVWAAGEQCLYRFHAGQPTQAFLEAPVKGEAIRALCPAGDILWVGTYYGALLKCDSAGVHSIAPGGTLPGGITCIVPEAENTLWISTSEGLHRWENDQIRSWNTRDGLLTAHIRTLHRDADGTLWLGTLGGGLARFKNGHISHITTQHGLVDDVISQILPDDSDHLWLGTNRGIMRLKRSDLHAVADGLDAELHPMFFGRNDGMLHEQCTGGHSPTAIKTRDGRLLFPTVGGIAEIDPKRLQFIAAMAPRTIVEAVKVDGKAVSLDKEIVVPPGMHRLQFEFTAPALHSGEWLRFRHQLEGLDKTWLASGSGRTASYDGLDPGHYVFHVMATGDESDGREQRTSLALTVQPHFWQTLWFQVLAAALVVGLNGVAVWRHSHHKHRQRIAELERERRQQADLAHASRVSLLGELSASLSHELKQPLAAILTNAQASLRFLDNDPPDLDEVRSGLKDITLADRRANEIMERMRAMMKKGESELEARDLNADIHEALLLAHSDLLERHVSVITNLAEELPPVNGDHIQLQQVLLNLIINACDAMMGYPSGERELMIETEREGSEFVRVSVTDRGTGVAPEMLEQIFEPFYSTKKKGLGMGLSICQAIIKAHGGKLWALNHSKRGTTFRFNLVVQKDESNANESVTGSAP